MTARDPKQPDGFVNDYPAMGSMIAKKLEMIDKWGKILTIALAVTGLILAFLIGLAGTAPKTLLSRWASFLLLVGFLSAMIAPGSQESQSL